MPGDHLYHVRALSRDRLRFFALTAAKTQRNGNMLFVRGLINVDMIVARIISCFRNSDARTQAKIIFM
nr:MAG TPA: hypothetical protein [Caudoviricetes sp.]